MGEFESEFQNTIGELLGIHLALFEHEWQCRPDDLERARMVTMISEAYKNFTEGGLPGFKDDFDRGYKLGKRDVRGAGPYPPTLGSDGPAP